MNESEWTAQYETVDGETNTTQECWWCQTPDMLLRDPRELPSGSVFAYCPGCGGTYIVRLMP